MNRIESQHTEWKESWRDAPLRWVCGFANTERGRLEIGHNDKATILANAFFRAGEHLMLEHRGSLPQAARRARRAQRARQIEAWGRGIQRIFDACRTAATPEPQLRISGHDLWLEFPFSQVYLDSIGSGREATAPATAPVTDPVTDPVHRVVLALAAGEMSPSTLWIRLGLKHRPTFRENYLRPALAQGLIAPTIPDKPNSRLQKYRLTEKGRSLL